MTKTQLLGAYPLAAATIDRLCQVDSSYGSQRHQRHFVQRLHAWQSLAPCGGQHEHKAECYPADVVARVDREIVTHEETP